MGPLLIGGGGGVSTFLSEDPLKVWETAFPEAMYWVSVGVNVAEESRVDFLETEVDVERESVVKGLGEEAKFLKEGSDIRGAFQGNRRITMQQKIIARDQMSAG